jgi:hypothetical protein
MEPEGSLPCSQEPSTGPYPEPDQSSPNTIVCCSKIRVAANMKETMENSVKYTSFFWFQASTDFWNGRNQWLPTWSGDDVALQVDYIKVWAI